MDCSPVLHIDPAFKLPAQRPGSTNERDQVAAQKGFSLVLLSGDNTRLSAMVFAQKRQEPRGDVILGRPRESGRVEGSDALIIRRRDSAEIPVPTKTLLRLNTGQPFRHTLSSHD
jgi:hypothetical protein